MRKYMKILQQMQREYFGKMTVNVHITQCDDGDIVVSAFAMNGKEDSASVNLYGINEKEDRENLNIFRKQVKELWRNR